MLALTSTPETTTTTATAADVLAAMNAHNRKVFWLSVVSTMAVSVSALFTLYRTQKLLRREFGKRKARKS